MRISHRLTVDNKDLSDFSKVGVLWSSFDISSRTDAPFKTLRIDEESPSWPKVRQLLNRLDVLEIIETEFQKDELLGAGNLCFLSKSFSGFSEPDVQNFGYRQVTYDLSDFCDVCGIGLKQKAPFRLSKEPKWGRRQTFQLNWVFDEVFVEYKAWENVFKPFGIDCWPVNNRSGEHLENVVQLRIDEIARLAIDNDVPRVHCNACDRVKYLPISRGYRPSPIHPKESIFKSDQFFGDGGEASRALMVSQELYQAMTKFKLNCNFWACLG